MSGIIQTVHFADDQYRWRDTDALNCEILVPSIIQTVHFADDQGRDTEVFYYTDGSLRR